MTFVLNRVGGGEVLKMIAAEEVSALAAQVAAAAGADAVIETKTSKTRFVASVKVPPDAQAKDGVLSRAAASVGLEINAYPKRPPKKAPAAENTPKPKRASTPTARKRGRPRKSSN